MACDYREASGRSTEEIQSTHPQRLPSSTKAILKRREYDVVGGRSQIGMQNTGYSTCNNFDNRVSISNRVSDRISCLIGAPVFRQARPLSGQINPSSSLPSPLPIAPFAQRQSSFGQLRRVSAYHEWAQFWPSPQLFL